MKYSHPAASRSKNSFENKLRTLNAVSNELSRAESVDDLCRQMIELGSSRLGFDRMSLWFVDKNPNLMNGSFGIDEMGKLRYEKGRQVAMDNDLILKQIKNSNMRSIFKKSEPMRDHKGEIIGKGSLVIAAVWNNEEIIGYIFTDNLLKKKPVTRHGRELLELYAATFGHLYQAVKMKLGGEVAGGIAHEVKNSLGIVLQGVEYLSKRLSSTDKDINFVLDNTKDAVEKANKIMKSLIDHARISNLELTAQDLNSVIDSSLSLVKYQINKNKIDIVKGYTAGLPRISLDKHKIEQVFINIFLNAVYSMADGGTLTLKTYRAGLDNGGLAVFCEIEDTGIGIPEDAIGKIFHSFFTTRGSSGGSGMGLSVVRNLMNIHGGSVKIENRKDRKGARVTLAFPDS